MCLSCLPLFASLSPPKNINVVASLTPSIQAWPLKERVGWNRALKSYASSTLSVLWGSVKRWWGLSAANNLDLKAEVKAWFTPVALLNCSYSQLGWWCGLPWEGLWIVFLYFCLCLCLCICIWVSLSWAGGLGCPERAFEWPYVGVGVDVGCPERAFELPDETNIEMGPAENWDKLRGGIYSEKGGWGAGSLSTTSLNIRTKMCWRRRITMMLMSIMKKISIDDASDDDVWWWCWWG